MNGQLQLIETEPNLKPRQQAVLEMVRAAGIDGVDAADAGALAHSLKERNPHMPSVRCEFCGRDGQQILERLRSLGLVAYRRRTSKLPGGWIADELVGKRPARMTSAGMLRDDEAIPF